MTERMKRAIKAKAILGLEMTKEERALYILLIATDEEWRAFMGCVL